MSDNLIKSVKIKNTNNTEVNYQIDATQLDGQVSSYYATAEAVETLQTNMLTKDKFTLEGTTLTIDLD